MPVGLVEPGGSVESRHGGIEPVWSAFGGLSPLSRLGPLSPFSRFERLNPVGWVALWAGCADGARELVGSVESG